MGDSETMVAPSSATEGYSSTGYPSSDYAGANTDTIAPVGTTGHPVSSSTPMDSVHAESVVTDFGATNSSSADPESVMQDVVSTKDEANRPLDSSGPIASGDQSMTTEAIPAAVYESNANGDITGDVENASVAGIAENGATSTDGQGTDAPQQHGDGAVLSAEEERLWNIVRANSLDFNTWTTLLEETEKTDKAAEENIIKIRKVYDAFLAEFPLCYGYWKKYADHELHVGALNKVVEVYERAVQGVTYSVDIWLHYCVFAISTYGDPDTIRSLFERGLAYVGADYLSYPLWDKYIEYEYTQQEWGRLAMIYTRILENPNQQLDRYFNSFKELAGSRPLAELRTPEEGASSAAEKQSVNGQGNEGEVHPDSADQSSKSVDEGLSEAEELQKYITVREELYKKAKDFDSKIIDFERNIRRPYFHVRPLSEAELENWHHYLDFIEREGDFNKVSSNVPNNVSVRQGGSLLSYMEGLSISINGVVKLYERCLVACANYSEYWIRYILCMEASGSMDLADNALARATQVFIKRQPEIHLFAAHFKEQHGDITGARAAYKLVHSEISPGLIEAIINHANMERRLEKMEDAFSLYEQAISIEKGKEHSQTLPVLFAQYSRFVYLVYGDVEKARDILGQALEQVQLSKPLLEALIYFESIQTVAKRIEYLQSLVEKFITPDPDSLNVASFNEREELSSIFLEFLGLFGDVQSIKRAREQHFRHFLRHKSSTVSRKRDAEEFLASDKSKLAKLYSGIPSTAPVVGTYPAAQTQWPAGYGSQPQPWPQPAQAQAQAWNPGYAQQPGYSGYYGNYAQPQAPSSAPQAAAYGAYPPTYTAQAYPQQAYVAPASAAGAAPVPVPVQQPAPAAAAGQAYYGAYY